MSKTNVMLAFVAAVNAVANKAPELIQTAFLDKQVPHSDSPIQLAQLMGNSTGNSTETGEAQPEQKDNTMMYIIIGAVVVLVIVAAILIFCCCCGKKDGEAPADSMANMDAENQPMMGGDGMMAEGEGMMMEGAAEGEGMMMEGEGAMEM